MERSTQSTDPDMKHATSRMLFAYWDGLRAERAAPDRREIEPTRIRHILADTFILSKEGDEGAAFRLAGTRCSALFGRDLKGVAFAELWSGDKAGARRLVDIVTEDTVGVVASVTGWTDVGTSVGLELVLLPLRHSGRTNARVLGTFSPGTVPSWMGLVSVTSLETCSVRVIRNGAAADPGPARPTARRKFVVLEGGRA